jgi:hypothetical protein
MSLEIAEHAPGYFFPSMNYTSLTAGYRCPMECSMSSNADAWSCTIEIRYEYNSVGEAQPHVLESFGPVIENKSHVELWIRRAQAAVLSPHRPRADFLAMSESEIRENAKTDSSIRPFSKNVVQVSVKDPAATDLSFVDLPGNSNPFLRRWFLFTLKNRRANPECRGGSYQYGTISRGESCFEEKYDNRYRYAYERYVVYDPAQRRLVQNPYF